MQVDRGHQTVRAGRCARLIKSDLEYGEREGVFVLKLDIFIGEIQENRRKQYLSRAKSSPLWLTRRLLSFPTQHIGERVEADKDDGLALLLKRRDRTLQVAVYMVNNSSFGNGDWHLIARGWVISPQLEYFSTGLSPDRN